jgi:hypothetical protein
LEAFPPADDPVLHLAAGRAAAGSRPGQRTDSLGLIESFDAIYGSSSGSLNASYAAAGQVRRLRRSARHAPEPRRRRPARVGADLHRARTPVAARHPEQRVCTDQMAAALVLARFADFTQIVDLFRR